MNGAGTGRALPPGAIAMARLAHLAFFLLTAAYCLLTYNAFAYRQFIKPHLVVWLTDFVVWHHAWYWLLFVVTAATLVPELRSPGRGRSIGRVYLVTTFAVGVWLVLTPVLPQVENSWRGLVIALAALVPPLWLAVYDHCAAGLRVTGRAVTDARWCRACLLAGTVVWVAETVAAPWLLTTTGEIALTPSRLAFGAAASAVAHAILFTAAALTGVLAFRLARRWDATGRAEYWAVVLLFTAAAATAIARVVFGGLAFTGPIAWTVASCLAATVAATWSGAAHRITAAHPAESPIAAWTAPMPGITSPRASAFLLLVLVGVIAVGMKAVEPIDWDFLFQRMWVLGFWALALAYAFGATPARAADVRWRSLAAPPALAAAVLLATPRLPVLSTNAQWVPEFVLEGYGAAAPSFHLLRDVLRVASPEDAEFYRYLRDNSTLQQVDVAPVSVDFVPPARLRQAVSAPAPASARTETASGLAAPRPPHIFLFVIDSLRRDYLSPYNPAVTFTPGFDAFAKESVIFDRAFTRYGGTGLSVPAIWSGGMLFHKQYVTPFAPMNALMKLLDAGGYRRVMSLDSVVAQIFPPHAAHVELDRDVAIVDYNLCRTLEELQRVLPAEAAGGEAPLFVYSLPQNLHISQVRTKTVPPGRSFAGFVAPVAAEVERMDACFATFIGDLKRRRLYDDSVIIVTADHGDSLGEARRWGHSYTMFPEIVRVPLIVHVPARLRDRFAADPTAPALTTDITPSLYALLGHPPDDLGPLFGVPLFRRTAADAATASAGDAATDSPSAVDRPTVLTSSYGAVYAMLRDGGRSLYVADGVNDRDYAYDLTGDVAIRIGVTEAARVRDRAAIRDEIDRLARLYRFDREP